MRSNLAGLRLLTVLLLVLPLAACPNGDQTQTGDRPDVPPDTPVVQQQGEHTVTVFTDTGEEETITLAAVPPPENAPTCDPGTNRGTSKSVGPGGDEVRLEPPQSRRLTIVSVPALSGAPVQTFRLSEMATRHPEVELTSVPAQPERQPIIDMSWGPECTWPAGVDPNRAGIYQWYPNLQAWRRLRSVPRLAGVEGNGVTAQIDTLGSRFAVGAN